MDPFLLSFFHLKCVNQTGFHLVIKPLAGTPLLEIPQKETQSISSWRILNCRRDFPNRSEWIIHITQTSNPTTSSVDITSVFDPRILNNYSKIEFTLTEQNFCCRGHKMKYDILGAVRRRIWRRRPGEMEEVLNIQIPKDEQRNQADGESQPLLQSQQSQQQQIVPLQDQNVESTIHEQGEIVEEGLRRRKAPRHMSGSGYHRLTSQNVEKGRKMWKELRERLTSCG